MGFLFLSFLGPNDITVNTTIYCVIQQQLNNRKFIHESMTTIYHVSCEKSIQAIELIVFERLLTVKQLIACSTEQLLVFNTVTMVTHQSYSEPPEIPRNIFKRWGQIFVRTISSTTRKNVKELKTWLENLIIFVLYEGDGSQESFSLIVAAVGV